MEKIHLLEPNESGTIGEKLPIGVEVAEEHHFQKSTAHRGGMGKKYHEPSLLLPSSLLLMPPMVHCPVKLEREPR